MLKLRYIIIKLVELRHNTLVLTRPCSISTNQFRFQLCLSIETNYDVNTYKSIQRQRRSKTYISRPTVN